MSSQTNNKRSRSIVMKEIVCFLGFLLCFAAIGLIVVNSCELLALHASGYTAEATVSENLRKSRARVQFTDYSGVSQTATISRIRIFRDANAAPERYTIRYSPRYPGKAVVCELPHVLVSWLVKIISLFLLILTAFALFPYSWFRKEEALNKKE